MSETASREVQAGAGPAAPSSEGMSVGPSVGLASALPAAQRALAVAENRLLGARRPSAGWRGRLSTSALSTATAAMALLEIAGVPSGSEGAAESSSRNDLIGLAGGGLDWLATHPNADGGWGDTPESASNLSTTTLVWAALEAGERAPGGSAPRRREALAGARQWISDRAGSLEPQGLRRAIEAIYGEDRTFSIPILTHCALAGVLGPRERAFGGLFRLPFELAALPQSWFRFLGLPVVSYALPALIAVGQVQHRYAPTAFAPLRLLRGALRGVTLKRLAAIQPASGGYLEAIPLTSFALMSLAGAGRRESPVVERGIDFLVSSVRADGSWPIDVDLATWSTTLSIQALTTGEAPALDAEGARELRRVLLAQRFTRRHPFTGAAPGGWAWTDLPGGVPDADDTASALLALAALEGIEPDATPETSDAVRGGIGWLLDLRNRDGGIPTFCRGWGKLPFDRSAPDLTAHALRALAAWRGRVDAPLAKRIARAQGGLLAYLERTQGEGGAWIPLWFGNENVPGNENPTYGTARVLRALAELDPERLPEPERFRASIERGVAWLVATAHPQRGGGGAAGVAPSVEETALAVEALASLRNRSAGFATDRGAVDRVLETGARFLAERIAEGALDRPAPIGFYFANLWYSEDLYPAIFAVGALRALLSATERRDPEEG